MAVDSEGYSVRAPVQDKWDFVNAEIAGGRHRVIRLTVAFFLFRTAFRYRIAAGNIFEMLDGPVDCGLILLTLDSALILWTLLDLDVTEHHVEIVEGVVARSRVGVYRAN